MTLQDTILQQSATRAMVTDRLNEVVARVWTGLGSWDEADVETFLARVLPIVEAGQMQVAQLTDVYIASVLSQMMGRTITPVGLARADVTALRPDVTPQEVYRRPFVEIWTGLSQGLRYADALQNGQNRLLQLVSGDLGLAHRTAAMAGFQSQGVGRYRRVLHPEAHKGLVCGLCIAASSQVYKSKDLMPIHTHCACEPLAIIGDEGGKGDPGRSFNGTDVKSMYQQVLQSSGSVKAEDLKKVRVAVHDHGELGPVLAAAGDHFTGPSQIAA